MAVLWGALALLVLVGALVPAAVMGLRGSAVRRLIAVQQASSAAIVLLVLLAIAQERSDYLIVPLVAALLSFVGVLVFVRLLVPPR